MYQTHDDEFNLGQNSFECGRRNNALKLWTMWKAIGTNGIANIVDQEFKLADSARIYVKNNSDYKLYSFEESLSVCFNYKDFDPEDLCAKLYESNTLMIGFGNFQNKKLFLGIPMIWKKSLKKLIFSTIKLFLQKAGILIKRSTLNLRTKLFVIKASKWKRRKNIILR